jgi:3-hydroxyacyl-CoA dehydrogenase
MLQAGLEETNRNFEAMIIANEGETFSAGANLMLVLLAAQEGEWEDLNLAVERFQQMNMALKYAAKPVVAAPFSRTLGGGCELVLHCTRAQASAETYMGQVEVAVGLIPGAGGCKELLATPCVFSIWSAMPRFPPAPKMPANSGCCIAPTPSR